MALRRTAAPKPPKIVPSNAISNSLFYASNREFSVSIGERNTNQPVINYSLPTGQGVTFSFQDTNGKQNTPENKNNVVTFKDVAPNIDLKYSTLPQGLKEEVIIKKQIINKHVFNFSLNTNNAYPQAQTDSFFSSTFFDKNGQYLFHLEKPFAVDAKGNRTDNVTFQIKKNPKNNSYFLTLNVDRAWLESSDRVYPISIDPTVVHDTSSNFTTGQLDRVTDTGNNGTVNFSATGGTITYDGEYTIHTFTSDGTFTTNGNANVEVLVVGGGGGGANTGSGGGAGGYVYNSSFPVTAQAYSVTVGNGGTSPADGTAGNGSNGGNSIFSSITVAGGGGGVTHGGGNGKSGGSGSGGTIITSGTTPIGGSASAGNAGGAGYVESSWVGTAGGGGGAGSVGGNGGNASGVGNGGTGLLNSIGGTAKYYAAGGGGGEVNGSYVGTGGSSIGGSGTLNSDGTSGTINTGSGGGGGSYNSAGPVYYHTGGTGGSGIVIIRYKTLNTNLTSYYQELPSDQFTVGLWHLNETSGNALDSSGNSNTGTPTGTTITDGLLSKARSFNGTTSDFITVTNSASLKNAFTIEAWVNTSAPVAYRGIVGKMGTGSGNYNYTLREMNTGYAQFGVSSTGSDFIYVTGTTIINDGKWHHIAGTYIPSKSIAIYVDGILQNTNFTSVPSTIYNTTSNVTIGSTYTTPSELWSGLIDEVRISNIARSPGEIALDASRRPYSTYTSDVLDLTYVAAWNSLSWSANGLATGDGETATASAQSALVAQWNFNETSGTTAVSGGSCGTSCNGTLTNFASTGSQDAAAGTGWTAANRRWGAGALMFDGTDDYVSIPNNTNLNQNGDISLELWINPNTSQVANADIISKHATVTYTGYGLEMNGTANSNNYYFFYGDGSTWQYNSNGNIQLTPNIWQHIVITKSGSIVRSYINGNLVNTYTGTNSTISTSNDILSFGKMASGSTRYWKGILDTPKIYSRALTASEVLSNYNSSRIEFQTRVGNTTDPNDGTWETWKPFASELAIDSLDQDTATASGCTAVGATSPDGGNTFIFTYPRSVFYYTGSDQFYTVPAGVTSINVKMWGGGGGGGAPGGWTYGYPGGGGGYTTGKIAVTPGQTLNILVGGGGNGGNTSSTATIYGGGGRSCGGSDCQYSGAGGGRSAIRVNGEDIMTAGGGGGGGSTYSISSSMQGGGGGGNTGETGSAVAYPASGGGGGTQSAGGTGGSGNQRTGVAGSKYLGGYAGGSESYGGGGGGGWYGGGGGAYNSTTGSIMGGGGGGSGYIGGSGVYDATLTAAVGSVQPNASDADNNGAGAGGAASSYGKAGKIVIYADPPASQSLTCTSGGTAEVLVVAGGGGGGFDMGGGGGGGGVIYNPAYTITANSPISVTVGAGGNGAPAGGQYGQNTVHQFTIGASNGQNSVFGSLTAIGGGAGGSSYYAYTPGAAGSAGGSGGGASGYSDTTVRYGGAGTAGQGFAGGNGSATQYYSGGGGGAGGPGTSATSQAHGGIGFYSDILGQGYYWGGGGGGAGYSICGGNGGPGGGGGGAVCTTYGGSGYNPGSPGGGGSTSAQTNRPGGDGGQSTGGGGGGGSHYNATNKGGDGGSGIVIVRLSKNTYDTQTKIEGLASLKYDNNIVKPDNNTVGYWHFDEATSTAVFSYTGADQTYTVPAGVTSLTVKLWGGGGGGGAPGGWTYGYPGGGGGYTTGNIAVTPGQVLTVMVGGGGNGGNTSSTARAYGGGGPSCYDTTDCRYGGAGGGRSAIRINGEDIITAGGGGGGGSTVSILSNMWGGGGGGNTGMTGAAEAYTASGGGGGTQSAGGAAGTGSSSGASAGSQYLGGQATTHSYGGGGGGGWYGGGGGAYHNGNMMGGGGGGSGYISGSGVSNGSMMTGYYKVQANSTDPQNGGAGNGGAASSYGAPGKVIITPDQVTTNAYEADSSNKTNSGTLVGTTLVDGIIGKARSFNGSSDRIEINRFISPPNITIEAWVYRKSTTVNMGIVRKEPAYALSLYNDTIQFAPGNNWTFYNSGVGIELNRWVHVAATYDGVTLAIYKNGVLVASWALNGSLPTTYASPTYIGYDNNNWWWNGYIDEVRISNVARPASEIAMNYRLGLNRIISTRTYSSTDLSGVTKLPFWVASDRLGTFSQIAIEETTTLPSYYDYDNFEKENAISDDWLYRNSVDPDITNSTSYSGEYSLHMPSSWGQNFESGAGEPASSSYDTNTYPYMCMAYKIPSTTYNNMLVLVSGSWRSITMTQGDAPTSYAKAATWLPLVNNNTWQYKCINVDAQMDAILGTGTHTITAVIWHDGGGQSAIAGEFWIDDFIISATPYYPEPGNQTSRFHNITIDFKAKLASGNLITGSGDYGFTVDETAYGSTLAAGHLFLGDKIIVKENYNGAEYIAQGIVNSVNQSTGAVTVVSWDSGSTFPSVGYSTSATVFKWQREYFDITGSLASQRDAITRLTYRLIDGSSGANIWLDDLRSSTGYLTNPFGSTITSSVLNRYFQYRAILSQNNTAAPSASLNTVTLDYVTNEPPSTPTINASYLHDKVKTLDTTPEIRFSTTDPENDDLIYQIEYDTTSAFTSATSKTSDTDAGFADVTTPADTNPFTAGNTISYTFQSALTNGTTYYYRVRAKDDITGTYSSWSSIRSFTIDTSISRNMWFETMAEQFSTDTISGYAVVSTPQNAVTLTTAPSSSTIDLMEYSSSASAQAEYVSNAFSATGGTISTTGIYQVHKFTASGSFVTNQSGTVESLIVAGGAAGGNGTNDDGSSWAGGGAGGAGGQVRATSSHAVSIGTNAVVVGAGGANSSFASVTATTGAGAAGGAAGGTSPGAGTAGTLSSITGTSTRYGGGGGGGVGAYYGGTYYGGAGGSGGGGKGGDSTYIDPHGACVGNAAAGTANTGGGGGGGCGTFYVESGKAGGSGVVIIRYPYPTLMSYSESTIKTQGSYSLKGTSQATYALNQSLISTPSSAIDLTGALAANFDLRASRTGSNIKIGLHDSGGTTTEYTPNITVADTFQSFSIDLSGVSDANKDAIDRIIITIVNADAANTFYLDNMTAQYTAESTGTLTSISITGANINTASNWREITFNDDGTSNIVYQVYYDSGGTPTIVPDSALSGNSTGFVASPIDISSLSFASYPTLYLRATLSDSGGTPYLYDWGVSVNAQPNTPTLNSPSDTATGISLHPTLTTSATDPDGDGVKYKIVLCTDAAMTTDCQTFDQTISTTGWSASSYASGVQASYTLQTALTHSTTYYWQSAAIDYSGSNKWSATQATPYSFTTSTPPEAPSLDSPTDTAVGQPLLTVFKTTATDSNSDVLKYKITVCTDAVMTTGCQTFDQTVTTTGWSATSYASGAQATYTLQSALTPGTVYYWKTAAIDQSGSNTWSATQDTPYSFTTNEAPNIPSLDTPANGATGLTALTTFQTTGTDNNSDTLRYKIEICTNSTMTTGCQTFSQLVSTTGWSATSYASGAQATYTLQSALVNGQTYYWRSYSIDSSGSNTWSATQATPYSFETYAPSNSPAPCNATKANDNSYITINWTDTNNEANYQVWKIIDSGLPAMLGSNLAADTIQLVDSNVSNGHSYNYLIRGLRYDGSTTLYSNWCSSTSVYLGVGSFLFQGIGATGVGLN